MVVDQNIITAKNTRVHKSTEQNKLLTKVEDDQIDSKQNAPKKLRQQAIYAELFRVAGLGYGKKAAIRKRQKKMQFTRLGQIQMSMNRRKALITNQRRAIKMQKEKNTQFQTLLTDQLEKTANLQMCINASRACAKRR